MVLSRLSFLFFLLFFLPQGLISQSVGIGANQPHTSSLLDVHDTLKGVLFPRMSSVQRQSILQPATGLLVFDTDSARYCFYTGQDWHCLGLPPGQASGELLFWDGTKWAIVRIPRQSRGPSLKIHQRLAKQWKRQQQFRFHGSARWRTQRTKWNI